MNKEWNSKGASGEKARAARQERKMGYPIKIDERAFNRGVDEVLSLRPVRRALGKAVGVVLEFGPRSSAKTKKEGKSVDRQQRPSRKH